MILLIIGWVKAIYKQSGSMGVGFVSVIVAVRNEESTLPNLIESLASQDYPKESYEIILVDDHSTDKTSEVIDQLKSGYPILRIIKISSKGIGKKKAITEGVEVAHGEVILTTDADCIVPTGWIEGMMSSFSKRTQLVIGTVKIKSDQTFFSKLQALEFNSVIGTGMGLLGWGSAFMCNGASLAFRKSAFKEVEGYEGNFDIPSGDDEFLMRKIDAKYVNGIAAVSKRNCVVETVPLRSLHDFIHQRLRWAGKWKTNTSVWAKLLAVYVFGVQMSWLLLIAVSFFSKILLLLFVLKILLEFVFLLMVSTQLKQKFHFIAFITLQIIYPVYVIWIGIFSQVRGYYWKGRRTKQSPI